MQRQPALYPKAEGALQRSLEANPGQQRHRLGREGGLANARHEFADGLEWGERARSLDATSPEAQAVIGDALLELGRYDDAFAAYQRMVDLAPGLASYTRASYALDLQGDVDGARRTLNWPSATPSPRPSGPSPTMPSASWPGAPATRARRSTATRPP